MKGQLDGKRQHRDRAESRGLERWGKTSGREQKLAGSSGRCFGSCLQKAESYSGTGE